VPGHDFPAGPFEALRARGRKDFSQPVPLPPPAAVFQLPHNDERTLPCERRRRFNDREGIGGVITNPKAPRGRYLAWMEPFPERLAADCFRRMIGYPGRKRTSRMPCSGQNTRISKRALDDTAASR
jgi:hypothetical protein